MMNNVLRPGTIVCACYGDFDCNKRVGIFCVLYDEQLDGMLNNNNVTAIKITTSMRGAMNYSVPIFKDKEPFLDQDCYALCSKVHTLSKQQTYKILGVLSKNSMFQIYKIYNKYSRSMLTQIENYI